MQATNVKEANEQPLAGSGYVAGVDAAPQFHENDIKRFEWRFKQRPSVKEMLDRGIISRSQAAVIAHEADLNIVNQSNRLSKNKTTQFLDRHLCPKTRMSKSELQYRNIVPQGYFDDAWIAKKSQKQNRRHSSEELQRRLAARATPDEIFSRGILTQDELQKDYEIIQQQRERNKEQMANALNQKIQGRPPLQELTQTGVFAPIENDAAYENDNIVKDIPDSKDKLENRLNKRPSLNDIAASGKMDPREFFLDHEQVIKEHDEEVKLLKKRLNDKINCRPSRYEMAESGKIDPLEFIEDHEQVVIDHQEEIKNLKNKLENKIYERPSRYQMAESGKIDPLEFVMDHEAVLSEKEKEKQQLKDQLGQFIQHLARDQ